MQTVQKTFHLSQVPVSEPLKPLSKEVMTSLFGPRAPTSKYCLSQMEDVAKRVGIRFVNELINLKHSASFILKASMAQIVEAEVGRPVDWAEILLKSLEKELKNVDTSKGRTRMAAHLYLLLGIAPGATQTPNPTVSLSDILKYARPTKSPAKGASVLNESTKGKKRKRQGRPEQEQEPVIEIDNEPQGVESSAQREPDTVNTTPKKQAASTSSGGSKEPSKSADAMIVLHQSSEIVVSTLR